MCTNSIVKKGQLKIQGPISFFLFSRFFYLLYFENSGARVSKASFNYFTRMTLLIVSVS